MSGEPSCAITEPSRNSTKPWTTDCGWTTTSSSSGASANKCRASISSRPLFISVAELIVIFGSHRPGRMFERLLQRDFADCFKRPSAKWAAGGGQHDAPNVFAPAGAQRLKDGVMLGIDRQHRGAGGGGAAHEQAPAQTRHSLLASATVAPRSAAASVGLRLAAPVIAAMTHSAGRCAASTRAAGPAAASIREPESPAFNSP